MQVGMTLASCEERRYTQQHANDEDQGGGQRPMPQKQLRPIAMVSICAPQDALWLEQWEAHLHPLVQAGSISIWSARHLQAGMDRMTLSHSHLDQADLIVLLLSVDFFTDEECEALMKRALERHREGGVRLIPLLLRPVAFRETMLASLIPLPSNGIPVTLWHDSEAAFDDCVRGIRLAISDLPLVNRLEDDPQGLSGMGEQDHKVFQEESPEKEDVHEAIRSPRNPYKGLQAFRMEDAQDFFGRDCLIEELLKKVRQLCTQDQQDRTVSRLLTILGPTGSGKSSVVMAGLLPKLKQGGSPGSASWIFLSPMVPEKDPLEALTLTLTALFPERSLKSIREDLEDKSARGLHLLLTTYVKSSGASVLLIIDQFEELFTQTTGEVERQHFLDLLLTVVTEPDGPLLTVITLRADFYDRPLLYPKLGRIIEDHHVTVYPLEIRDLRTVIEQPARLPDVQLIFEEDLVGDLLFDVQGQVGALPLLQFTLDQLFQHREGRLLTRHAYRQIGGVKGALAKHAETTYQVLPTEKHQRLARALFLRLINLGTVEEDATRRRVSLSELVVVDQEEMVNRLKVGTKVSVESLCVRRLRPKRLGRRFEQGGLDSAFSFEPSAYLLLVVDDPKTGTVLTGIGRDRALKGWTLSNCSCSSHA
jgi:conflict system STAND superfamily ATPase/TIR domain-containing protein